MPPRNPTKHLFCSPPRFSPPPRTASSTRWCSTPSRKRFWPIRGRSGWAANTKQRSQTGWQKVWGKGGGELRCVGRSVRCGGGVNWTPTSTPPPSPGESDNRNQQKMEMKVWDPDNPLTDRQIDQFLVVARSADAQGGGAAHWMGGEGTLGAHRCHISPPTRAVGTFARALDCSSSIRQPSLHMSAAAASRDITLVRSTKQHTELGVGWGEGGVS